MIATVESPQKSAENLHDIKQSINCAAIVHKNQVYIFNPVGFFEDPCFKITIEGVFAKTSCYVYLVQVCFTLRFSHGYNISITGIEESQIDYQFQKFSSRH